MNKNNAVVDFVDKISIHRFASKLRFIIRVSHASYSHRLLSLHCHNFSSGRYACKMLAKFMNKTFKHNAIPQ